MANFLPIPKDLMEGVKEYEPERRLSRWLRWSGIALAFLVLGIGSFVAFVPIGGAVIGTGQVGVQSRIKRISHPTGGVIARIYVQNGDYVRQGQELLRFDDKVSSSDAELAGLTVAQLLAARARLEAELLGAPYIDFPEKLTNGRLPGAAKALTDERTLFEIRRGEAAGIASQLGARITQYQKQIDGFEAQIGSVRKQQALIEPELAGVRELWGKGLVTIGRLNQIERTAVEMEGSIASLHASIAQVQARITEAREQLVQVRKTRRSDAGAQLVNVNSLLNQQQFRSVSAEDVQERAVVRALYSGYVDKLAFAATGDVIRPAETIMEIVPDKDQLLVEGAVSPEDINQVKIGQKARIRFTAFKLSSTPEFFGTVTFVAPERTTDPASNTSYYALRIQLDDKASVKGRQLKLKPGMPAELLLETGSRSMLSYLTKPLRDQLSRAFRDNSQ